MVRPGNEVDAREILQRFRQAAIEQSAEGMTGLYAVEAVHEFPFTRPGVPARLVGRQEIVDFMVANWTVSPLKYESYRTLAIHDTADPNTIIVEQEVVGTSSATGPFLLPNIVVLTVSGGQIAHFRDYVNVFAAGEAIGRPIT
ncbi:nuclear transport factor 2 family protein [Nocardia sp. CA-084685]|uniref:nuclear transport factor 2 family protein n=1 Tax=Nocardia sp. CA-084685 TaxID=3239970 RepID=UPI003D99F997